MNTRRMLTYVFSLVRTQKGCTAAKYSSLGELKALVQSPSVARWATERSEDFSSIQRIANSFPALQLSATSATSSSMPPPPPARTPTAPPPVELSDTACTETRQRKLQVSLSVHSSTSEPFEPAARDPYLTCVVEMGEAAPCTALVPMQSACPSQHQDALDAARQFLARDRSHIQERSMAGRFVTTYSLLICFYVSFVGS